MLKFINDTNNIKNITSPIILPHAIQILHPLLNLLNGNVLIDGKMFIIAQRNSKNCHNPPCNSLPATDKLNIFCSKSAKV